MKKILVSIAAVLAVFTADAQTPFILGGTSYSQTFDAIGSGLPLGWRVDSLAKKSGGLGNNAQNRFVSSPDSWNSSSRGFKNIASADGLVATSNSSDQSASTDRALGIRQAGASGWDKADSLVAVNFAIANTTGLTGFNLNFKWQVLTPQTGTRRYNTWIVQYGIGTTPTNFTTVATTPAVIKADSNVFSNVTFTANFGTALNNISQPVWIRIIAEDTTKGSGSRPSIGLDDFNLTWSGAAVGNPKPSITTLTPADNTTNLPIATNSLSVMFDKNILPGTGAIKIANITDGTTSTINMPTGVTVSGSTATINGLSLLNTKSYAVLFDSTCFVSQATGAKCYGIYDSIQWNFSTELPAQAIVTTLNESFTGCLNPLLASFRQQSLVGAQTWLCSTLGRTDSNAVRISGFGGGTQDNTDWLISPPINASAMSNPALTFWSRKTFTGVNTKEVFISTDFTNNAGTATWTNLNADFTNLDTIYQFYGSYDLNAYKATPFRIGFKYVSVVGTQSDTWYVDDVNITDFPVAISNTKLTDATITVLGTANTQINISVDAKESKLYNFQILNLTGSVVAQQSKLINAGTNNFYLPTNNLNSGIYLLKVSNNNGSTTTKFIK